MGVLHFSNKYFWGDGMELELEVKVLGMDIKKLENQVIQQGGSLIADEEQVNILIDSKEKPIKSYLDAYFRIRETRDLLNDKTNIDLTLKKNIGIKAIRQNQELNVKIDDKDTMLKILKDLGFDKLEVGYKKRRSYDFMGARLDFDTWDKNMYPYPYMEIEVMHIKDLHKITKALNIPQDKISTKSIKELRNELSLI